MESGKLLGSSSGSVSWNGIRVISSLRIAINNKRGPFHKCEDGEPAISHLGKKGKPALAKFHDENMKGAKSACDREDIWTESDKEKLERYKAGRFTSLHESEMHLLQEPRDTECSSGG